MDKIKVKTHSYHKSLFSPYEFDEILRIDYNMNPKLYYKKVAWDVARAAIAMGYMKGKDISYLPTEEEIRHHDRNEFTNQFGSWLITNTPIEVGKSKCDTSYGDWLQLSPKRSTTRSQEYRPRLPKQKYQNKCITTKSKRNPKH